MNKIRAIISLFLILQGRLLGAEDFFTLGMFFLDGIHVNKDEVKAIELIKKAAKLNYPPAFDVIGSLYLQGEGVPKNLSESLDNFKKAADFGYGPGQFNCAMMFRNGQGTKQNFIEAFYYLCLASNNGKDLDDLTEVAAKYRDEIGLLLSGDERREVFQKLGQQN